VSIDLLGTPPAALESAALTDCANQQLPIGGDEARAGGSGGIFSGAGEIVGDEGDEGATDVRIDHYAVKVQKTRDIAQTDPKAVANIIKDWMGANAG